MAEETIPSMYGYETDEVKQSNLGFGLNNNCYLTKFVFNPNGGKDGAEQECLDIVFNINGTEKSYRKFPIVKAFGKNNEEITDPNAPEFRDALKDLNATIFHIVHCFVSEDVYKAALARPITSFKQFCDIVSNLLPKDFNTKKLDIFLQYQYNITGSNDRTYLEIPKKMSYGKWLCPHIEGNFTENIKDFPKDTDSKALWYVNEKGEEHLFIKNGWFMNSPFAKQQKINSNSNSQENIQAASTAMNTGTQAAQTAAW